MVQHNNNDIDSIRKQVNDLHKLLIGGINKSSEDSLSQRFKAEILLGNKKLGKAPQH